MAGKLERREDLTTDERSELIVMLENAYADYVRLHGTGAPHRMRANVDRNRALTFDWLASDIGGRPRKAFARDWNLSPDQVKRIVRTYEAECRAGLADVRSMWMSMSGAEPYWRRYVAMQQIRVRRAQGTRSEVT